MQIVVDGQMTYYDVYGPENTKVILLLHGWGDRASGLRILAQFLVTLRYKVIVPDLPGFGGSEPPKIPWGLTEYTNFVAHFLGKINSSPLIVIGHSNGGAIAISGIANGNIQTQKVVLLASAGIRSNYRGRKKILRIAAKTAKFFTSWLPKKLRYKLRKKAYGAIGSDMFVAEHMQETFKKVISDDVQLDAKAIRIPSLLLYGADDTATPAEYGKIFSRAINNSKLVIIPNAGHFIHIDAQAAVEQRIKEFIR